MPTGPLRGILGANPDRRGSRERRIANRLNLQVGQERMAKHVLQGTAITLQRRYFRALIIAILLGIRLAMELW